MRKQWFCDNFKGTGSYLICLNLLDIRSEFCRRSLSCSREVETTSYVKSYKYCLEVVFIKDTRKTFCLVDVGF